MSDREDAPMPPRDHNGYSYWGEVAEFSANIRDEFSGFAEARPWGYAADLLDCAGIAQAVLTVRQTRRGLEETADSKALRSAAKKFLALLETVRDTQIEATAAAGYESEDWIDGEFVPAIAAARKFAQPAPMTGIWHIAEKVTEAIVMANRALAITTEGKGRPIPTSLGREGAVIHLTLFALRHTPEIEILRASSDKMRRAKLAANRVKRRPIKVAAIDRMSDEDGRLCEVIAKHLASRLPSAGKRI